MQYLAVQKGGFSRGPVEPPAGGTSGQRRRPLARTGLTDLEQFRLRPNLFWLTPRAHSGYTPLRAQV
jgi:hypothetical protein